MDTTRWYSTRVPEFLLSIGSCLLGFGMVGWLYLAPPPVSVTAAPPLTHVQSSVEAQPVQITHSQLGSVPIVEGNIQANEWSVSATTALHWSESSVPGYGSNIVIYGHNTAGIFAHLFTIQINDVVTIRTRSGIDHTYRVVDRRIVDPDRVDMVQPTAEETLTIYTCTGVLDSKRLVVIARRNN